MLNFSRLVQFSKCFRRRFIHIQYVCTRN